MHTHRHAFSFLSTTFILGVWLLLLVLFVGGVRGVEASLRHHIISL